MYSWMDLNIQDAQIDFMSPNVSNAWTDIHIAFDPIPLLSERIYMMKMRYLVIVGYVFCFGTSNTLLIVVFIF